MDKHKLGPPVRKVGARVWHFEENRRIYPPGRTLGTSPIWREHWRPMYVVGENRVSWLVAGAPDIPVEIRGKPNVNVLRCPKKPNPIEARAWCWSQAEIDERVWLHEQGRWIRNEVDRCQDPVIMRKVAELVGYKDRT